MTEPDAESPVVPASAPRPWDWRRGARWFGAEFLVVVTGVLVALALNAWWGDRKAEAREGIYLRQLVSDLRETERIMAYRDSAMAATTHRSLNQLFFSFGRPERPPRDSVETWLLGIGYTASPRPILGTAEALVASGDFGAVSDPVLRAAILRYLDVTREHMADQDRYLDSAQRELDELRGLGIDNAYLADSQFDLRESSVHGYLAGSTPTSVPADSVSGDWRHPFAYDVYEIYNQRQFLQTLSDYRNVVHDLHRARRVLSERASALSEQIEAALRH